MKYETTTRRSFFAVCAGLLTASKTAARGSVEGHSGATAMTAKTAQGSPGPEVSLRGKLKGGLMGPGGETTGYALQEARLAQNSIEIDISGIKDPGRLDGRELTVTGVFQTRQYVERGKVIIFKATSVKE
jgi:hypothetical protein